MRDCSLDPRAFGIDLGKFPGRFLLTPLYERLILGLGTDIDTPTRIAPRVGTQRARRALLIIRHGERDPDHLVLPLVPGRTPAGTGVPFRAGGLVLIPIDAKVADVKALLLPGLPAIVPGRAGTSNRAFRGLHRLLADQRGSP